MHEGQSLDLLVDAIADRVADKVRSSLAARASDQAVQATLLNVKEAAIYLGRSEQSVQHLIFKRDLPVVRFGRRVHLDRRDLDEWIENNKC